MVLWLGVCGEERPELIQRVEVRGEPAAHPNDGYRLRVFHFLAHFHAPLPVTDPGTALGADPANVAVRVSCVFVEVAQGAIFAGPGQAFPGACWIRGSATLTMVMSGAGADWM